VRIIAGEFRSRHLKPVPGRNVRPTSDRLRETLFNVLGAAVEGAVFVDAYAGTGAVGLEALSRGAVQAIFLEESRGALRVLEENVTALGVDARTRVLPGPATTGLRRLGREGLQPGFIFLDPPYQQADEYWDALAATAELGDALIVVEHAKRTSPRAPKELERLRLLEQGDSALSFYRMKQPLRPAPS
jgi:16S rRNA (guanine(966)-N(2))-methyltransferase RsmD